MSFRSKTETNEVRWIPTDVTNQMASTTILKYSNKMGRWTVEELTLEMPTSLHIRLGALVIMNKQATGETFYALSPSDCHALSKD